MHATACGVFSDVDAQMLVYHSRQCTCSDTMEEHVWNSSEIRLGSVGGYDTACDSLVSPRSSVLCLCPHSNTLLCFQTLSTCSNFFEKCIA